MFLSLAVLWGLSFPAIAVGLEYLPPLLFAAFRYDVAAVLLLVYAVARTDGWIPHGRHNIQAIVGGGLFLVAGKIVIHWPTDSSKRCGLNHDCLSPDYYRIVGVFAPW